MNARRAGIIWPLAAGLILGIAGQSAPRAAAQGGSGYSVTEDGASVPGSVVGPAAVADQSTGAVRLARFSFIQGNVTWRPDESGEWSAAAVNLPLRQDAQIWVSNGGRAEVQFDDGSMLRLGANAIVTLKTLYSDADGEFTEINLTAGLVALRARHSLGVFQVNTPLGSVKASGPAAVRVGVGDGLEVAVREGSATVEGPGGRSALQANDFLYAATANSAYSVRAIPAMDSWDRWNQERDDALARAEQEPDRAHLPADIAIVADDLQDYGSWRDDSQAGWVWCPRVTSPEWRPYHDGRWTWVNPFGWTWVASEPWGWAPYHYGTWVSRPYGWAWCPGPVNQYWSPAVVHFTQYNGQVAWCPLAPAEVRYPTVVSFGFRRGNWANYFAIGGAAVYYPTAYGYCAPRVYNTTYVNRVTYMTPGANGAQTASGLRFGLSQEAYAANYGGAAGGRSAFTPINARLAAGTSSSLAAEFGGRAVYTAVRRGDNSLFALGRSASAPAAGHAPLAGPAGVRPTAAAQTPSRVFTYSRPAAPARVIYRAAVLPSVARNSAPITPTGRVLPADTGSGVRNAQGRATAPAGRNTPWDTLNPTIRTRGGAVGAAPSGAGSRSAGAYGAPVAGGADAAARARAALGLGRPSPPAETAPRESAGSARPAGSGSSRTGRGTQAGPRPADSTRQIPAAPESGRASTPPRQADPPRTDPVRRDPPRTEPDRNRPATQYPPRTEPARRDPPREPVRTDPPRTEPARRDPPREPVRTDPPRSESKSSPPARDPDKSNDNGSKGSDSTNRGRPGKG